MPYLKFDDETLEPRVVREDMAPYVEILTTKRGRHHKTPPSPNFKLSIACPATVRPDVTKKRKQKLLWCKNFARAIDRFTESPSVYDESLRKPLPPLLSLPAELRHQILDLVLDDNEILFKRPNSTTQTLAVSCKTFAMDVREVNKIWRARENRLRAEMGFDRTGMSTYIDDLFAPLRSASKVYGDLHQARAIRDARQNRKRDRVVMSNKSRRRR